MAAKQRWLGQAKHGEVSTLMLWRREVGLAPSRSMGFEAVAELHIYPEVCEGICM
jgi:hypothetical protein